MDSYDVTGALNANINNLLEGWEKKFQPGKIKRANALRFKAVLQRAFEATGKKVVVPIDEYDKPVLDAENNPALQAKNRTLLRSFYSPLKSLDDCPRFVIIAGITKHAHVNIYSGLNNLNGISMRDEYAALCGITDRELLDNLAEGDL